MTTSPSSLPRPSAGPLFDSIGQAYEQAFQGLPSQLESIEWILSTAPANSSVLDIGTGTGRPVASTLSSAGHRVLGIDVSPTMISCAKSNVPSARFQCVDVRDFVPVADEPEQQFDVIVAYFSLIACLSQQELKGIIRRIGRELLKPGGIFVWGALPIDMEQETIEWMGKGGIVASALSREESLSCLREDAGLEVVREWESTFFPEGAVEAGICEREKVWEETHFDCLGQETGKGVKRKKGLKMVRRMRLRFI